MNRSRLPMATGWPFLPTMHPPSHWFSCGQTRPVMAGRELSSRNLAAATRKSPAQIRAITSLTLTPTGQSTTQPGLAHSMQRVASVRALAASRPRLTSSKLRLRTAGSASGMGVRRIFIRSLSGRVFFSDIVGLLRGQFFAKLGHLLFLSLLKFFQRGALLLAVHGVALHEHLEVDQRGVKLRPVHAGKLALVAQQHAAAARSEE